MYLFGAGGHARVIRDVVELSGGKVDGFIDDNLELNEKDGLPVLHSVERGMEIIIAIGDSRTRYEIVEKLKDMDIKYPSAIHPSCIVSPSVEIGEGTVLMPGAIVNAYAKIGMHCVINTGASVGHEVVVGDFATVCPHSTVCGQSVIGEGANICAGSVVVQCTNVGRWTLVGAGTLVRHDVGEGVLVVGNDCHEVKKVWMPVL